MFKLEIQKLQVLQIKQPIQQTIQQPIQQPINIIQSKLSQNEIITKFVNEKIEYSETNNILIT